MLDPNTIQILITILGSGAIFSFLQFLISRQDTKQKDNIETKLKIIKDDYGHKIDENRKLAEMQHKENEDNINKILYLIEGLNENDIKINEAIQDLASKQDAIGKGVVGQAHDRLLYITDKIIERGVISNKEKSNIESMYFPYYTLGGNGEVKRQVDFCMKLPVVTDAEAHRITFEKDSKKLLSIINQENLKGMEDQIEIRKYEREFK